MNLQPISPSIPFCTLPQACTSCSGDVNTTTGFADLDGKPWQSFCCGTCASIALGRHAHNRRYERDMRETRAWMNKQGAAPWSSNQ
jgi:hypothetical protein